MNTTDEQRCGCPENEGLRRRGFLKGLGGLGAAAAAGAPLVSTQAAYAATGTWNGPVLLVLSLRGGMDGLSVVAPVGDPDYARLRPGIAVPGTTALPTGDRRFGLHPAMAPLAGLWKAGKMSAIHAVGTPDGSRSHFRATEELERAAPGTGIRTGWLNRVLGAAGTGTAFEAVQLGRGNPAALLAGPARGTAMRSLKGFSLAGSDWVGPRMNTALKALHTGANLPTAPTALLTLSALDTAASVARSSTGPQNGAVYPTSDLGRVLADAALLIRANVGLQALTVDVGDWDMHSGLGRAGTGWMADKVTDLSTALAAFARDLGALFDRVTVVTMSEFGRRAKENGSGGVDHGHGNAVLLLGGGLNGGKVHGTWPGLTDAALDNGDLRGTTDYRNVLAEILVKRTGLSTSKLPEVFPGLTPRFAGAFA
ncbi:DUF1501 domain-containing protein [Kineococcus sp. NUM-3379]